MTLSKETMEDITTLATIATNRLMLKLTPHDDWRHVSTDLATEIRLQVHGEVQEVLVGMMKAVIVEVNRRFNPELTDEHPNAEP